MRSVGCGLLLAITVVGCGAGGPPFDELPLRDALRAEPDVVAALPDDARARLASRFQSAGARDTAADPVESGAVVPSLLVTEADTARQHRSADALVVGLVGGGAAQAMPAGSQAAAGASLPPLEGLVATSTAALETRALAGAAGASLGELLAASRATRMERVVGWPVAAVAIGDTVYVNGAWLVALAPGGADGGTCDSGTCDGGAGAGWSETGTSGVAGRAGRGMGGSFGGPGGMAGSFGGRGGAGGRSDQLGTGGWPGPVVVIPPYTPPPPPPPNSGDPGSASDAADGCAALAGDCDSSGDDSSDDSCGSQDDGSDDSCGGSSDDGSADACSQTSDGTDANCQTAPGRRGTRPATIVWLFAPLIYLWGRKR